MSEITINNNPQVSSLGNIFDGDPTQVVAFTARNNTALNTMGGQLLNVTGNIVVLNNNALTRLFNFESTTALTGALVIVNNDLLDLRLVSSNTRLGNLQTVGDSIRIVNNPGISRLTGLGSLQSARKLEIRNNGLTGGLSTLDDLASLTTITEELFITGNPNLSNCCELACDVFVNGQAVDGTNDAVTISGNTGGCVNKPTFTTFCAEPANNDGATGCFMAAPVELLSFTGTLGSGSIDLTWATASESDNAHFEVERAVAGGPYVVIGRVAGSGNSQQRIDYGFADTGYAAAVNYYRLRQVDFDGTEALSDVVAVDATTETQRAFTLYPHPVAGSEVRVRLASDWSDERVTTEVFSAAGRRVLHSTTSGSTIALPTGDLSAGTYAVRITADGRTLTQRLIVR